MTGYELDKIFKDSLSFFWQAQTSQIYRELDAMERKGWLVSKRIIQSEKPNKRVYSITVDGKKELDQWLMSPSSDIDDAMKVKSSFIMRVFFSGEVEQQQALSMLYEYQDKCLKNSNELKIVDDLIANYSPSLNNKQNAKYWKIAALYGEINYKAGLEWVKKAISIIEGE